MDGKWNVQRKQNKRNSRPRKIRRGTITLESMLLIGCLSHHSAILTTGIDQRFSNTVSAKSYSCGFLLENRTLLALFLCSLTHITRTKFSFFQLSKSSQCPYRPAGIEDDDPTGQQWGHSEDEVKWAIDGVYEAINRENNILYKACGADGLRVGL
jgi:hypothetical protein